MMELQTATILKRLKKRAFVKYWSDLTNVDVRKMGKNKGRSIPVYGYPERPDFINLPVGTDNDNPQEEQMFL